MLKKENWKFKPVVLLGVPRSGTTLLGKIISQQNEVSYWVEPKYIWKYPKPNLNEDIISINEIKESHIKYINKRFSNYSRAKKKKIFLEKTPSNCLRIPMVRKTLPNSKVIVLVRRSPDVIISLINKWSSNYDNSALLRRFNINEYPLIQLPVYIIAFIKILLRKYVYQFGSIDQPWGPMTAELLDKVGKVPIEEVCAQQYILCMLGILDNLKDTDLLVDYKRLIISPESELKRVAVHIGLDRNNLNFESVRMVNRSNYSKFTYKDLNVSDDTLKQLEVIDSRIELLIKKRYDKFE